MLSSSACIMLASGLRRKGPKPKLTQSKEEKMFMSEQYKAAFVRALIVGGLSAITTATAAWQTLPTPMSQQDVKTVIAGAVAAFLTPFIARFGGEGYYDTRRAQSGNVNPGDVQPRPHAA